MNQKEKTSNLLAGILFLIGILVISYTLFYGVLIVFITLIILYKKNVNKKLILSISAFLIGFFLYRYTIISINTIENTEVRITINRLSLLFIIGNLIVVSKVNKLPFHYHQKPKWKNTISFPFIWSGFHTINISTFLFFAILVNIIIFLPFIFMQDSSFLKSVFLLAILFSIINSILEEIVWRGYLLSHFKDCVNENYALIFTSIGFGLQHISIGIPLIPSILFSFGGMFFAGVVMRSTSIYPSIIWHFVLNFGMVFSGFILK